MPSVHDICGTYGSVTPSTMSSETGNIEVAIIDTPKDNISLQDSFLDDIAYGMIPQNGVNLRTIVEADKFGDAEASDVTKDKTFTSVAGVKVTGTMQEAKKFQCTSFDLGEETSDSGTKYITFTPAGGYAKFTPDANSNVELGKCYITKAANLTYRLETNASKFGTATAADVAAGKTFTSAAGLKITGTKTGTGSFKTQAKQTTPSATTKTITPDSGYDGLSSVTVNGDSNLTASNIKSGVSIFGVTGTYSGSSSGGSSNNNVEAYLVDVTNPTVSFKTNTGTIKVYGYATASTTSQWGGSTTTQYAFDGDGYYNSRLYGTPTKTRCTFGVSNGKLTGLPTLNSGTLLVVRGI